VYFAKKVTYSIFLLILGSVFSDYRAAQAMPVRPPDTLRRRTHLSGGRAASVHDTTPDTTRLSRLPVDRSRRDAGQAGSYA